MHILKSTSVIIALSLSGFFIWACSSDQKKTDSQTGGVESESKTLAVAGQADGVVDQTSSKVDYNGHQYVDLGLPSGLKWATSNIGANAPEEYGDYFAWGETKMKDSYTEDNCATVAKDNKWLLDNGYIDDSGNLTLSHDAARQNWGGSWRMPTADEIQELYDNTTNKWTKVNNVKGRLLKSKVNGDSIFFPASGYYQWDSVFWDGQEGYYWGSTPSPSDSTRTSYLYVGEHSCYPDWYYRYQGRSVRAVSE